MYDDTELRRMSPAERARLARALAALDSPRPDLETSQRRRRLLVGGAVGCTVVLAIWIGVLAVTLPRYYRAGGWRLAWVGFDVALLVVFAMTAWAAWRRRQILILCLIVMATLLFCDAWFDTTLDAHTKGFMISLLTAVLVELPLATLAMIGARRLLRLTIGRLDALEGVPSKIPFWRVPLFGDASITYSDVLARQLGPEPLDPLAPVGEESGPAHDAGQAA